MSTQKLRRNFRNNKNNKEHKQKQRQDALKQKEAKLEKLKHKFNLCLKQLSEFEESKIFSRDDDNTISDVMIESDVLNTVLNEYEKLIQQQKDNYVKLQTALCSICGDITENTMNLDSIVTELDTFYDGIETQFANEKKFKNKLIENLNKMHSSTSLIAPLIFGKHVESPLNIAIELSSIYSAIKLEKKQYSVIKKELKKHEHDTLTTTMPQTPHSLPECTSKSMSNLYEIRDLTEIEKEISQLRKRKAETMKMFIGRVYGNNNSHLKELKLKRAALHYADSIADDEMMSLNLQGELLEVQCEELENELIGLEIRRAITSSKQSQLLNVSNRYLSDHDALLGSSELKRLQKVEREQRRTIELTEQEISNIDQLIYREKEKQKNNKLMHETSYNLDTETDNNDDDDVDSMRNEFEEIKKERMALEEEVERQNEEYKKKRERLKHLSDGIIESLRSQSDLQRMIHQYENHITSKQHLSKNVSRKKSQSLEFMHEMEFMNKEYEIKVDQINNKYREKQTFLKNKFVTEYSTKIKKNTAHRQSEIEQESYNIISKRKDKELQHLTRTMTMTSIPKEATDAFTNKTKPVKIKFGKVKLIATTHAAQNEDAAGADADAQLLNDVLKPIKFEWNADNDEEDEEDLNDGGSAVEHDSNDANNDDKYVMLDYKDLMTEMDQNNVNVCDVLNHQIDKDKDKDALNENVNNNDEIQSEYLTFNKINMMNELLGTWGST
eukprot:25075_1